MEVHRPAARRYPEAGGADTNVTVLVTNVGADYTKLGSFGSAQDFGQNLVVSMDRTYLLRRKKNVGPVQVGRIPLFLFSTASAVPDVPVQFVAHVHHGIGASIASRCKHMTLLFNATKAFAA